MTTQDAQADAGDGSARERILRTAFQLFHEQGYHATGIATILRESGLNPGSMYHAFESKAALLAAVLEYALRLLRPAVIEPVEAATADPLARVFALLDQYRAGMVQMGCRMGCPIGNLALEVSDDHPEARRLIDLNFQNWTREVQAWLDAARDRLPSSADTGKLARFILTVMEGGLMQARAAGNLQPFDDSVAQLRAYFDALHAQARLERRKRPSKQERAANVRPRSEKHHAKTKGA